MSRYRNASALVLVGAALAGAAWACTDDATPGPSSLDGGTFTLDAPPTPLPTPDGSGGSPDAPVDGGDGGNGDSAVTCKTLLAATPNLPSGMYAIDLDGAGTAFPSIMAYCDMTFDGGGWTMIQSFTGADSPNNLVGQSPDAGVLVRAPQPGTLGGLADWI